MAIKVLRSAAGGPTSASMLKRKFIAARLAYKRLEWAAEYFVPLTTRRINGPPVPEAETSGQVIAPYGLQVIEGLLFPGFRIDSKEKLVPLLDRLSADAVEYRTYFVRSGLQDWQILDAVKLEVFRVEALGLNDFDDPLTHNCFAESATALSSLRDVTLKFTQSDRHSVQTRFQGAINFLSKPSTFNNFDRAVFLISHANPLTSALTGLTKQLQLKDIRYNRLLNRDAATLFEQGTFNANAYIAAPEDSMTKQKIVLGRKLFFDPLLSGTMTRSCGSCHQPEKAFTDGLVKNIAITGKKTIARNTPTLINAALQPAQFYDLRAPSLEDQIVDVIGNRDEMHGNMTVSTQKLWKNKDYRDKFTAAFPRSVRKNIDTGEVMNALASYIRSLTALNSRFDHYMQGRLDALNQTEIQGFNLFMGKARCGTCHFVPLFNGALPPRYMQMDAEVIGVTKSKNAKVIDGDPGRFGIIPLEFNRHAFKVPTVRNAARTAPYMHNGVFTTLEEVTDFYNKGGGGGQGIKIANQTLSTERLHLTDLEISQVVSFIKALDSH
ncbi:cytochrome c peroxidase [Mucilaginibacter sp. UYCu711]|uniref:cytochrome-c peroxidase n=1 Tax=Mucilaginibacter sp. UYCu711 TaxID=3156339 RepID=UPI003D1E794A